MPRRCASGRLSLLHAVGPEAVWLAKCQARGCVAGRMSGPGLFAPCVPLPSRLPRGVLTVRRPPLLGVAGPTFPAPAGVVGAVRGVLLLLLSRAVPAG